MNPARWDRAGEYYDLPYFYIYDADSLVDGSNYMDLPVFMADNTDFILRRVAGVPSVVNTPAQGGRWQWRDPKRLERASEPYQPLREELIIPEVMYPPGSAFSLDLYNVLRANRAYGVGGSVPNWTSQFALQGVKRIWGGVSTGTQYRYRAHGYNLTSQINVAWPGRLAPAFVNPEAPRQFSIQVDDYDFNLQAVNLFMQTALMGAPASSTGFCKLMLYGPRQEQLSSAPVLDAYLNMQNGNKNNVFPAPSLLYPAGGIIRFDVISLLLNTEVPAVLTVSLIGERRIPC